MTLWRGSIRRNATRRKRCREHMRQTARVPAAMAVLVLSACVDAPPTVSNHPEPNSAASYGSPTAPPSTTLHCSAAIDSLVSPSTGYTVILGVVALPIAVQTNASGQPDPTARLFAKSGLEIWAGAALEIVVPEQIADRFSIGWGSPPRRTRQVVVQGCPEGSCPGNYGSGGCDRASRWLVYAGGYWGKEVDCLPLEVVAGGRTQQVLIGFGAPCPRQKPYPQPTQT